MNRRTLAKEITVEGVALHAGTIVRMTLKPAAPFRGVIFRREDCGDAEIPALYHQVSDTRLGTVIGHASVASVGVVEHLLSALAGAEIDDLEIVLNGPEPPILNGDALGYLELFDQAGVVEQGGRREAIEVLRCVGVKHGKGSAKLIPDPLRIFDFEIAFCSAAIGRQNFIWQFSPDTFRRDIAPARTFGFVQELETLNNAGLGLGASLGNTLAIDGDKIVNDHLLRFPDEFVRHKILDAIGDLSMAGAPIVGRFEGRRSGHALNNQLLRELFADSANFARVPLW